MSAFVSDSEAPSSAEGVASTNGPATTGHVSQTHTAKRHREILRDYSQEFRQTKARIVTAREREDLLGSVSFVLSILVVFVQDRFH